MRIHARVGLFVVLFYDNGTTRILAVFETTTEKSNTLVLHAQ